MATDIGSMSAEQIVADSKRYTLYDWQAQSKASPLAIDRAEGVYMYGADGRRWLDFSSQLMGVNIGHGDKRVTEAIARQAEKLPYISPFQAFEGRAVLGKRLAGLWPGDIEKTFFTLAGAEANENAVKIAKLVTGRQKVMARYRSYHGSTYGTMMLTGDPRRWPNEQPPMPGVVHVLDPYHGPQRGMDDAQTALAILEETIELEGPQTIAAFILETVVGTNGILIPPDGYLQGVRELCTKFGIVMIADEVMCGWGRTGEWFAVDHWNVVPDLITTAKGLTSSYAPLGAVGLSPRDRGALRGQRVLGRPHLQHPSAGRGRGDRRDRRAGGRRPGGQRQAARPGDARASRGPRREAPQRRPDRGTSGCSASSSS